ncbi:16S rRNA (uracil(1498)-N(3))-methyltransferase [Nocardioides marmoriginsengisoli]|uniref:Ribosomal RNA small subunit methyltransferase E n=1 Tax=Nocardioides marmoriginsengisoli TaxID=661483 RepID=A0A3N0CJT3_9ACTN|nr:16S rRNA (uracil(1498)-N(3))-methyltransferase [Nocardioides marmoriginsengisoli]RNL63717.1 16S rRNA (uracil(1498)-N(3))-methyltransferase [Nocardioides marmoriginsengisoli]
MTLPVFLADAVAGARPGDRVTLDGDEGRHAATVKRIRVGEQLALTDGAGTTAVGNVVETAKASLVVEVVETAFAERATPLVTVVQAIPKGDRGELAVEVLTEIDVDRIVPWAATRSVAVWRGDRAAKGLAKWQATARTAAKQARRSWLPEITPVASTQDVVDLIAEADLAVVLHEDADLPLADLSLDGVGSILVVVGPEGGISADELVAFSAARAVRLGSSVLRTSTAGVAAVAALLARTERWR